MSTLAKGIPVYADLSVRVSFLRLNFHSGCAAR
jgi:hypothetical protein